MQSLPFDPVLLVYAAIACAAVALYHASTSREAKRSAVTLAKARAEGTDEPVSLHPVINESKCIGCGACVKACPEGDILGVMRGKAHLVDPSSCIGHGACASNCPTGAITLVFGSERRGVEIPAVGPDFQTNVPGLFIAGELGGMGLIRNAVEQGRQAIESMLRLPRAQGRMLDVVIVGAGPAGISATLRAKQARLKFETIEQDSLGGTIAHYPRGKVVMTSPATLPIVGRMKLGETSKESLMAFWRRIEKEQDLEISFNERVDAIDRVTGGFHVVTSRRKLEARNVLLAIGRRGTPRKLGVAGEELPKVVYQLVDPEQYRGRKVLVAGGGDSAIEAALSLAEQPGTHVILCHRGSGFPNARQANRARLEEAQRNGLVEVLLETQVQSIAPEHITLATAGTARDLRNDHVIVCAGGILPTQFLKKIGISVETKYGTQ